MQPQNDDASSVSSIFTATLSALLMAHASPAAAQTKVEAAVEQELAEKTSAKVIITTRPDLDTPNGGPSMVAPQAYVSQLLSQGSAGVKQLGSFRAVATHISRAQLEKLRSDPNVEAVYADIPVPPATDVTVRLIGADKVHDKGFRGTNLAVAILDTGIDAGHAAMQNAIAAEACFSTNGTAATPSATLCPNGLDMDLTAGAARKCPAAIRGCDHGTHVAGIVAGRSVTMAGHKYSGVSPAARVIPIQVFSIFTNANDCRGQAPCVLSYPSDQLRALDWVYKKRDQFKIASVNMSLGGGYFAEPCDGDSALTEIIERLRSKGVLTVIAAGNEKYYDGVSMPGCISSALTVAASTKAGAIDVSYSNVSPYVDIVAPGTLILSSVFGNVYEAKSGTSMAAPHVAGAIALLREEFPGASAAELEAKLKVGAPSVTDARTGTTLAVLDVAHSIPPGPGAPIAVAAVVAIPDALPSEFSFIIQSQATSAQMANSVAANCGESCELKRISDTAWKLDVAAASNIAKGKGTLTADDVRGLLSTLPLDAKVFSNTPSAPLSPGN